MNHTLLRRRWAYLALGIAALLFAGVIYAWSILKTPLAETFGWSGQALALNYTLTMWCFCLGGFGGGLLGKRLGSRICLLLAALLAGGGFVLASRLSGGSVLPLYLSYGGMGGLGIGLAYMVSRVSGVPLFISWYIVAATVVFSALVGLFFGAVPAVQAARLNPIDALRRE